MAEPSLFKQIPFTSKLPPQHVEHSSAGPRDHNDIADKEESDVYNQGKWCMSRLIRDDVDPARCLPISLYACFLSGFTSSITFSVCYVWCGFQTGNVAQLGLALARLFAPHPHRLSVFHPLDQAALVSLTTFIFGVLLGHLDSLFGGSHRRTWLWLTALIQTVFCVAAGALAFVAGEGIAVHRDHPSWNSALGMAALGFLSASMGLQGIVGKRIGTPLNATIVLTTTIVELFGDPHLASPRSTPSRDIRILATLSLFLGSFAARASAQAIGPANTIWILAGLRLVMLISWGLVGGVTPQPTAWEKAPKDRRRFGSIASVDTQATLA